MIRSLCPQSSRKAALSHSQSILRNIWCTTNCVFIPKTKNECVCIVWLTHSTLSKLLQKTQSYFWNQQNHWHLCPVLIHSLLSRQIDLFGSPWVLLWTRSISACDLLRTSTSVKAFLTQLQVEWLLSFSSYWELSWRWRWRCVTSWNPHNERTLCSSASAICCISDGRY